MINTLNDNFDLLRLTEKDLTEVFTLENSIYSQPWTYDNFLGEYRRTISCPLGIKKNGQVIAYCFFWLMPLEAHLLNLAVSPNFRRKGLARRLLKAMIFIAGRSGAKNIYLEARAGNFEALNLYKSLGFYSAGRRPHYYEDGEDALLMTLDL